MAIRPSIASIANHATPHHRIARRLGPPRPRGSSRSSPTTPLTRASSNVSNAEAFAAPEINTYHVSLVPYLLAKLKAIPDGDGNLLDNSLIIYGSAMGNSNLHNHKRCPLFFAGHAGGALKGNQHIRADDGTPMANAMLPALRALGVDRNQFGDSTRAMDLNPAPAPTAE